MKEMVQRFLFTAVLAIGFLPSAIALDEVKETIVRAQHLHTGTGEVLSPGAVLIRDGKIEGVAESIESDDAAVVEVHTLIPGLVDAYVSDGLVQAAEERTEELTPELQTADIIVWNSRSFQELLSDGCTTVHVVPATENVIGGQAAVVKTASTGGDRVLQKSSGMFIALCRDPASGNRSRSRPDSIYVRQPTNRMGVVWMLRNSFHKAAESEGVLPRSLKGQLPIFAVSRTSYDILALLEISQEFGLHPTVVGGQEAWRVIDELQETETDVVLQRLRPGATDGTEGTRLCADTPVRLSEAGITFCLSEGDLLNQARFAVAAGLPASVALQAITSAPAAVLHAEERIGSIRTGRDADLVALNGDPMQFTTAIQWVMVNGEVKSEQGDN